jgi:hypothetical protein
VAAATIAGGVGIGFRLSRPMGRIPGAGVGSRQRTYYLDPVGSNSADGLSPGTAWRTLDRLHGVVLAPGDRVLLRGGARFTGMLQLDQADAGNAAKPVTIGSYGQGRATIAPDTDATPRSSTSATTT